MTDIRILHSLTEIDEAAWNACARDRLEAYEYLLAVEQAGMQGFQWLYVTAWQGKELLAGMPGFLSDYALDTTLEGPGRRVTNALTSVFPNSLKMKLACLGSPGTEYGLIVFHPSVGEAEKPALLQSLLKAFEAEAIRHRHHLIGLKDIPSFDHDIWDKALISSGYKGVPGLPVATLDIDFQSLDDYMARLSAGTRKDMRRKLRSLDQVRIEHRFDQVDDVMPRLMQLYRETRARADMQFEELTANFFRSVLRNMKGNAFFSLYYAGDELLGANLLLQDNDTLLDKFFFMDDERGRDYNLYFLSWFINIDHCLDNGLKYYQSGQAAYDNKVRLGSRLTRTTMYFRHHNILLHGALRLVAPLLAADDTIKEVA